MDNFANLAIVSLIICQMIYKVQPTVVLIVRKRINFNVMGRISVPPKRIIGGLAATPKLFFAVLETNALVIHFLIKTILIYSAKIV